MHFRRQSPAHKVDFLFVLSLFCVFTVTSLLVVIIGANVYHSTVTHMEDTYSTRTALSYVTEKIRRHDEQGMISLTELDGVPALMLYDHSEDASYVTYIYSDGGSLLEFTVNDPSRASSGMGQEILKVRDFSITAMQNGFLLLSAEDTQKNTLSLYIHPRNSSGYSDDT